METFKVHVLLFGRASVGKTSLLAAMFNALQTCPAFGDLSAQSQHSHDLDAALDGLKKYIRTFREGGGVGLPKTASPRMFTFTLGVSGFEHKVDIIFTDMPGETLNDPLRKLEWINLIRDSDIIINTISTPAMMENGRHWNEDINKPSRFKEYIDAALETSKDGDPTKIFYLVPIKCEKYLTEIDDLSSVLQEVYANHRRSIRSKNHCCYGLPVSTLGSVVFDRFELVDAYPYDHYKLISPQCVDWSPKNHDVLAAHILDHCISRLRGSFPSPLGGVLHPISDKMRKLDGFSSVWNYEKPDKIKYGRFETACFAGETLVHMADGQQLPISMIKSGMKVLARSCDGKIVSQYVYKVSKHINVPLISVTVGDHVIRVTRGHLIMVGEKWKQASQLIIGDRVVYMEQESGNVGVKSVSNISHNSENDDAYNIYVREHGTYFASGIEASSFVYFNKIRRICCRLLFNICGK